MTTDRDQFDWVDKLPDVLHRWHELTSHEQEAIGRLVNRIASQPLPWHEPQLCRVHEWRNTMSAGIEVSAWGSR